MTTDDGRRAAAARLRGLDDSELQVYDMTYFAIQRAVGGEGEPYLDGRELTDRLADLIEPTSDPTGRGVDSLYDWCRERLEGADGAEDELLCSVMRAIEDYRHPERATAHTVRTVDRDALLALAEDMDSASEDGLLVRDSDLIAWAIHIREALGVQDA